MDYVFIIQMVSISIGIIISTLVGIWLLFHSISSIINLKDKIKVEATILGWHKDSLKNKITRIEFVTKEGTKKECDLNSYSIYWRKGKKIKVYYNPNRYSEVEHMGNYFIGVFLGLLFLVVSIYTIVFSLI